MSSKSTPVKEQPVEHILQLDNNINIINAESHLFRSGNTQDGYSRVGKNGKNINKLQYFFTSVSGLEMYKPEMPPADGWGYWQYTVNENLTIINIPEYSLCHPLTVPTKCLYYFNYIKGIDGKVRLGRTRCSNKRKIDDIFYTSVFEQIRCNKSLNPIHGLYMPTISETIHEELVLDSVENLRKPYMFKFFAGENNKNEQKPQKIKRGCSGRSLKGIFESFAPKDPPKKKRRIPDLQPKSTFKQFVPKDTLRL